MPVKGEYQHLEVVNTVHGYHQYCKEVHIRMSHHIISTVMGSAHYSTLEGCCQYCWGVSSTLEDVQYSG